MAKEKRQEEIRRSAVEKLHQLQKKQIFTDYMF